MERKTLLGVLKTSQILPPKSKAHIRRLNPLIDFSVNRIKHRPQRLMAPHNTVQSTNQRSFIQNALQPKAERNMVSLAHHIPLSLRLKGVLNEGALIGALNRIVGRHEALRTVFYTVDGEVYQRIEPADVGFALRRGV